MVALRLDLALCWRFVGGLALGMALYTLVIVALYPEFRHDVSLNSLTKHAPTVMALLGVTGSLTSSAGWLNVNIYANFLPLVVLLVTISYGAACLAGQDHDGTLSMTVTLPLSRRRIAAEKILAMVAQSAVVVLVVGVWVLVGRLFDVSITNEFLLEISVALLILGVDLGLIAMATGAASGNRGTGIGIAAAVAVISYLVSSLAPIVSWLHSGALPVALLLVSRQRPTDFRSHCQLIRCARVYRSRPGRDHHRGIPPLRGSLSAGGPPGTSAPIGQRVVEDSGTAAPGPCGRWRTSRPGTIGSRG